MCASWAAHRGTRRPPRETRRTEPQPAIGGHVEHRWYNCILKTLRFLVAYIIYASRSGAPRRPPRREAGRPRRLRLTGYGVRGSGGVPKVQVLPSLYTSNDHDPCDTADLCCSPHALRPPRTKPASSCSELVVLRGSRSASRTACTHGGHATSCSDFTPLATHRQISPPRVQPRASGSWPGAVTCLSLKQDA